MAKFMLLIHQDDKRWADSGIEITPEYIEYTKALVEAGVHIDGSALDAAHTATIVARDGLVTDGPFAESAEQLGGYYLIDVADEAAAVEWAAKLPGVKYGLDRIEVRALRIIPGT